MAVDIPSTVLVRHLLSPMLSIAFTGSMLIILLGALRIYSNQFRYAFRVPVSTRISYFYSSDIVMQKNSYLKHDSSGQS